MDCYDAYREPPQGCGTTIIGVIGIALIAAMFIFSGCKSQQPVVTETNTNTLIEREQVDSLINVASKKCTIIKIRCTIVWKMCNKFAYIEIK